MRVKICGLTNLADARVAAQAGADLLGFNFYPPSPRYIAPDNAAHIIAALRAEFGAKLFVCVGVFVNLPLANLRAIQQQCQLDLLQLHGDESVEECLMAGVSAFKALRPRAVNEAETFIAAWERGLNAAHGAPHFLIDAAHPQLYGGTGTTGNWELAHAIARCHSILLAGGLTPTNVANAIRVVRPWGVDTASGVERAPGLKDASKVRQFIEAAKRDA
jgi:phosphoribosylanthranilate isomerase